MKEIERTYLLKDSILSLIDEYGLKKHKITQFYTTITPIKEVRYRQMDGRYFKTIKQGTGVSRQEKEVEISKKKFQENLEKCIKQPIRKNRYLFDVEGKAYAIDVFKKKLKGLYLLEIEFPNMKAFQNFKLPTILKSHVMRDVSFDESYKNKNIVIHGIPERTSDLGSIFKALEAKSMDELDAYFIPNLSPIDALRVILYKFLLSILFYKERILLHGEEEDLHQLRVNIRKSRAFLKEFGFLFPEDQLTYFYKNLSDFATQTNRKRDLDVIKERLQEVDTNHDGIQEDIKEQQEREQHVIEEMLKGKIFEDFFHTYQLTLQSEILRTPDNDMGTIKETAREVIKDLHLNIIQRIDALEKEFSEKRLHKIRISMKKLRYLLEEFQHIFSEKKIEKVIEKGKKLQTLLGDFNDMVNQNKLLHDYFKSKKKSISHSQELEEKLLGRTSKKQKKLLLQTQKKLHKFKKHTIEF